MSKDNRKSRGSAEELRRIAPDSKKGDISGHSQRVACAHCKRTFRVEIVEVLGWKERESVACPLCGAADAYSALCFSITADQ
jgi:hypothetical protein